MRGAMSFSFMPLFSAKWASSLAAATHMSSVTVVALTSRTPRNMAGNPRLLLIWLGKSLRPVPTMRAPASFASQGQISGMGFAQAKTMLFVAILVIHSFLIVQGPGLLAATTTSASFRAAAVSPVLFSALVFWASSYFHGFSCFSFSRSGLAAWSMPLVSTRVILPDLKPARKRT